LDFQWDKKMYAETDYKDRIVPLLHFAEKHRFVKKGGRKSKRKKFSETEVRRTAVLNNDFAIPCFWKLGL